MKRCGMQAGDNEQLLNELYAIVAEQNTEAKSALSLFVRDVLWEEAVTGLKLGRVR